MVLIGTEGKRPKLEHIPAHVPPQVTVPSIMLLLCARVCSPSCDSPSTVRLLLTPNILIAITILTELLSNRSGGWSRGSQNLTTLLVNRSRGWSRAAGHRTSALVQQWRRSARYPVSSQPGWLWMQAFSSTMVQVCSISSKVVRVVKL